MTRTLRLAALVVRYTIVDVRDHLRRRVLIAIDHLLHGAPCPCCDHTDQETDQ